MGCLGVHFALNKQELAALLATPIGERADYIGEVIEAELFESDRDRVAESDKAWDDIHRALTDGYFGDDNGTYPLNHVIMGGQSIYDGDDYIIVLKTAAQVREIAAALETMTRERLRAGYDQIDPDECGWSVGDEEFEYVWGWFEPMVAFYQRAAAGNYAVIFTASQ